MFIGFAKLAPIRRKFFIVCDCVSSHPKKPLPDVQKTPQERKCDPEVIIKHDELYARAWECDYERTIFGPNDHKTAQIDPPEIPVRSDLPPEETWNSSATSRECSPEFFP